jgi:hypothetical protein
MQASPLTTIDWCGAASAVACWATGGPASDVSKDGQKTSAMTAMITTMSTLATRVAFHANPGRRVSMLVLKGCPFVTRTDAQRRQVAPESAVVCSTSSL